MSSLYSSSINDFITDLPDTILGTIVSGYSYDLNDLQKNAWKEEIILLQNIFDHDCFSESQILFEYRIPRIGKRVDVVLLHRGIVFLLEFKVGSETFNQYALDQVLDYALDLKNFHKESRDRYIVPILVSTKASEICLPQHAPWDDRIFQPIKCNSQNIISALDAIVECQPDQPTIEFAQWENSPYSPTPTIIEAAQALYRNHNVVDISRSDSGASNLTKTTEIVCNIINRCRTEKKKAICFITGVPGAGKTLAGLNIANSWHRFDEKDEEHATFLSGNGPLVKVLRKSLALDKVDQYRERGERLTLKDAERETNSFIQNIHHFRDDCVKERTLPPTEKIVLFDEAQRAWDKATIKNFMAQKKGISNFDESEPEFLINAMDRHSDWAVIICLIGGGQEIHTGEAGLPEWFDSLRHLEKNQKNWDVFVSPRLVDQEYLRGKTESTLFDGLNVRQTEGLHLATSLRSFRSEKVSDFVKCLLDLQIDKAKELCQEIRRSNYYVKVTRDLDVAMKWVRNQARGTERYGIIGSSGALRLKPFGLFVKNDIDPVNWFLKGKNDPRSSFFLEDIATEFDVQGLELDYTIVAWDADFRYQPSDWSCHNFCGDHWNNVSDPVRQLYRKNAYRVLLTRARQGMVIFVPPGYPENTEGFFADESRKEEYYDSTYNYLVEIGIEIL